MKKTIQWLFLLLCTLQLAAAAMGQVQPRPVQPVFDPATGSYGKQITGVSGNGRTLVTGNGAVTQGDCGQWDANGNLVDAGSGCGASGGSVSGQAMGVIPLASSANAIGSQSHCDDGITTLANVTCTEPLTAPGFTSNGSYDGYVDYTATGTTNPTGPAASTIRVEAPSAGVTAYTLKLPATAPTAGHNILSCTAATPSVCSWASSSGGSGFTIANNGFFHGSGTPASSATMTTFSSALTPGSLIVVHQYSATATYSVPTDTAGNTYVDCGPGPGLFNVGGDSTQCFYALNTHSTASNIVTLHTTGATVAFFSGMAFEVLGAASSSPIDGGSGVGYSLLSNATGAAAGSNALSATAITPAGNGDLIVAFFASGNGSGVGTSPNAFTVVNASWVQSSEYLTQANSAAIAATGQDSASSDPYGAIVVAIKP